MKTKKYDPQGIFNIRVYGLLLRTKHLLVSIEQHNGLEIIKFPGGGLQKGEGTIECLKREFMEETGLEIGVRDHLYTTDFYQPSAFNPTQQVIGIYYQVESHQLEVKTGDDYLVTGSEGQQLKWVNLSEFDPGMLTFRTDQIAGSLIQRSRQ